MANMVKDNMVVVHTILNDVKEIPAVTGLNSFTAALPQRITCC